MYQLRLLMLCALFLVVVVSVGKAQLAYVEEADIDKKKMNLAVSRPYRTDNGETKPKC